MPEMPRMEKPPRHPRDYDQAQLKEIFAGLPEKTRPILEFILETGCRPSEACKLQWNDVDLDTGFVLLIDTRSSNARASPE